MWFAGNHSDVGGSYPESETRLSDISLGWMAHAFQTFPDRKEPDGFGIKVHDFPQHMRARCGSGCTRKDLSDVMLAILQEPLGIFHRDLRIGETLSSAYWESGLVRGTGTDGGP